MKNLVGCKIYMLQAKKCSAGLLQAAEHSQAASCALYGGAANIAKVYMLQAEKCAAGLLQAAEHSQAASCAPYGRVADTVNVNIVRL